MEAKEMGRKGDWNEEKPIPVIFRVIDCKKKNEELTQKTKEVRSEPKSITINEKQ